MTYEGLGAILFRFVGLILIGAVLVALFPAVAVGTSAFGQSQLVLVVGLSLLPAVALIVFSKPLGRIIAAGLD